MKLLLSELFLMSLLALSSCGGSNATSAYNLNDVGYSVVSAGTLLHNTTSVSGTGSIVVSSALSGGISSGNSYRITFNLDDSGILDLVTHASAELGSGVTVRFSRSGSTLSVFFITSSGTTDVSSSFTSVNASTEMTFQVDVHNDESPAHILIWPSTNTSSFPTGDALVNSEDSGKEAPGIGSGTYWGFNLTNAVLKAAALSDAKPED